MEARPARAVCNADLESTSYSSQRRIEAGGHAFIAPAAARVGIHVRDERLAAQVLRARFRPARARWLADLFARTICGQRAALLDAAQRLTRISRRVSSRQRLRCSDAFRARATLDLSSTAAAVAQIRGETAARPDRARIGIERGAVSSARREPRSTASSPSNANRAVAEVDGGMAGNPRPALLTRDRRPAVDAGDDGRR